MRSHICRSELPNNCAEAVFERLPLTGHFNRKGISTHRKCNTYSRSCCFWSTDEVRMEQCNLWNLWHCNDIWVCMVMETAKELHSSQKRACKLWGFLLIIYCYGWYVWLYICHTKNILPYIVHFARWSYWRPLQGKLMLMDGGWK